MMDGNELSRRKCLQIAGAAGFSALAGCASLASDGDGANGSENGTETITTRKLAANDRDVQREAVVNIKDVGVDATGEEPIDSVLKSQLQDDTHLHFPPGQYRIEQFRIIDQENVTITGNGARLIPPDGMQGYWLVWNNLRNFRFEGFTLDCRGEDVAPVNRLFVNGGRNVVRNVAIRGYRTPPESRNGFEIAVTNPDSELRFENLQLPDGTTRGSGVYVFPASIGKLVFKNCRIDHWGEGLYASPHSGPIEVLGGHYANNGIAQIRLGGGRNGSLVKNATVRVDNPRDPEHKRNMRGIWLKEGTSSRIEGCDVAVTDLTGTYSSGAIIVGRQFGSAEIHNCQVLTNVGNMTAALLARRPVESIQGQSMPSMDRLPEQWNVTCQNLQVRGNSSQGTAIQTTERGNCRYEQICIQNPQGSRNGFLFRDTDDCSVLNSTINVGGESIITQNAIVLTEQVRRNGSC